MGMTLLRRSRYLLPKRRIEAELAEEIEQHRAYAQRDAHAGGLRGAEAAMSARRRLGNVSLARGESRDVWIAPWLQDIAQDLRFAVRILLRDRRFTVAAVVALALGIGVTHSMFAVVNMRLIRELPFDRPDRLLGLRLLDRDGHNVPASYSELMEWRDAMPALSAISAVADYTPMNLSEEQRAPELLLGTYISGNGFS